MERFETRVRKGPGRKPQHAMADKSLSSDPYKILADAVFAFCSTNDVEWSSVVRVVSGQQAVAWTEIAALLQNTLLENELFFKHSSRSSYSSYSSDSRASSARNEISMSPELWCACLMLWIGESKAAASETESASEKAFEDAAKDEADILAEPEPVVQVDVRAEFDAATSESDKAVLTRAAETMAELLHTSMTLSYAADTKTRNLAKFLLKQKLSADTEASVLKNATGFVRDADNLCRRVCSERCQKNLLPALASAESRNALEQALDAFEPFKQMKNESTADRLFREFKATGRFNSGLKSPKPGDYDWMHEKQAPLLLEDGLAGGFMAHTQKVRRLNSRAQALQDKIRKALAQNDFRKVLELKSEALLQKELAHYSATHGGILRGGDWIPKALQDAYKAARTSTVGYVGCKMWRHVIPLALISAVSFLVWKTLLAAAVYFLGAPSATLAGLSVVLDTAVNDFTKKLFKNKSFASFYKYSQKIAKAVGAIVHAILFPKTTEELEKERKDQVEKEAKAKHDKLQKKREKSIAECMKPGWISTMSREDCEKKVDAEIKKALHTDDVARITTALGDAFEYFTGSNKNDGAEQPEVEEKQVSLVEGQTVEKGLTKSEAKALFREKQKMLDSREAEKLAKAAKEAKEREDLKDEALEEDKDEALEDNKADAKEIKETWGNFVVQNVSNILTMTKGLFGGGLLDAALNTAFVAGVNGGRAATAATVAYSIVTNPQVITAGMDILLKVTDRLVAVLYNVAWGVGKFFKALYDTYWAIYDSELVKWIYDNSMCGPDRVESTDASAAKAPDFSTADLAQIAKGASALLHVAASGASAGKAAKTDEQRRETKVVESTFETAADAMEAAFAELEAQRKKEKPAAAAAVSKKEAAPTSARSSRSAKSAKRSSSSAKGSSPAKRSSSPAKRSSPAHKKSSAAKHDDTSFDFQDVELNSAELKIIKDRAADAEAKADAPWLSPKSRYDQLKQQALYLKKKRLRDERDSKSKAEPKAKNDEKAEEKAEQRDTEQHVKHDAKSPKKKSSALRRSSPKSVKTKTRTSPRNSSAVAAAGVAHKPSSSAKKESSSAKRPASAKRESSAKRKGSAKPTLTAKRDTSAKRPRSAKRPSSVERKE